jgi:hypothetical protein
VLLLNSSTPYNNTFNSFLRFFAILFDANAHSFVRHIHPNLSGRRLTFCPLQQLDSTFCALFPPHPSPAEPLDMGSSVIEEYREILEDYYKIYTEKLLDYTGRISTTTCTFHGYNPTLKPC